MTRWISIILLIIVVPNVYPLSSTFLRKKIMLYNKSQQPRNLSLCVRSYFTGHCSIPGTDPNRPQKVNQDAWFDLELKDHGWIWGILDGHGTRGHLLTSYLAQQLPLRLHQELLLRQQEYREKDQSWEEYNSMIASITGFTPYESSKFDLEAALIRAFHRVQLDAMQSPTVPSARNGATCIVAAILPMHELEYENEIKNNDDLPKHTISLSSSSLWIAHVGDSRAILVSPDGTFQTLTTETTTRSMSTELERIQRCEGRIDANGNVWYGPQGIAMTRSLGNSVMLRAGIIPTPIIERYISWKSGDLLILATDGVWEVMSNEDVVTLVRDISKHGIEDDHGRLSNLSKFSNLAERIAEEARTRWIGDLPFVDEAKVDDITCLIVEL
jgi:serine/threonine protein phosphatase PrpC